MINFIKTILNINDPIILSIIFFGILGIINTLVVLVQTILEKKKENSNKIYILTLILIATILTITNIITTYTNEKGLFVMNEFREISMEYFESFVIILIIFTIILSIPIVIDFVKSKITTNKK